MNTEDKILFAAEQEFLKEGFSGARMQAIANKAGINKALVHYYYKSKSTLFETVFKKKIGLMIPNIDEAIKEESTFLGFVERFIEKQINLLLKNPFIPLFILSTISGQKNKFLLKLLPFKKLLGMKKLYLHDLQKGLVKEVNFEQFFLSLMGMCAYPFIGKVIVKEAFELSDSEFNTMMQDRIQELKKYVRLILKPE